MNTQSISETIFVNGMEMYFEVHGKGKPLLLLHGFTGSSAGLGDLFKDLLRTYQLIIPDLRGHGKSTNPTKKFTFQQAALDIFALIKHLNINRCSGIGFSGGGCTLLQMAYQQPDKIDSMAIISAAPYFPESTRKVMRLAPTDNRPKEDWDAMRKIHFQGDDQIKMLWQQAHDFSESYDDMNFSSQMLAQIKAKTFIVQGDRDPIYPLELTIEMFKNIIDSYLWIIPNGGHGAFTLDMIPEFISNFYKFMEWHKS